MADRLVVTAMTHRGAVREHNEDALTIAGLIAANVSMAEPVTCVTHVTRPLVVAVADGLGGHAGGEVAAGHAARLLAQEGPFIHGSDELTGLIHRIDAEVTADSLARPELAGMATTVAGLLFAPDSTVWFNVGDSRVYRLNDRYLGQLSVDDSPGAAEPGAQARVTHLVTQVVGGAGDTIEVHTGLDTATGCWLICSDGLSDLVEVEAMEKTLSSAAEASHLVKTLWALAMNASGRDNISILLVRREADQAATFPGG